MRHTFPLLVTLLLSSTAIASDEHAMLDAIARDPGDDTVRLAYADMLEETGDAKKIDRATFIRLDIRKFRANDLTPDEEAKRSQLLVRYEKQWVPEPLADHSSFSPSWRRGFPVSASITLEQLADPKIRAAVDSLPLLRHLTVRTEPNQLTPHNWIAHFNKLKCLKYIEWLSANSLFLHANDVAQMDWNKMEKLTQLFLRENRIGTEGVHTILQSPVGPRLSELNLDRNDLNQTAADLLLSTRRLTQLAILHLAHNPITSFTGGAESLPQLRLLGLDGTDIAPANTYVLISSPLARRLHSLFLPRGQMPPDVTNQVADFLASDAHHLNHVFKLEGNTAIQWPDNVLARFDKNRAYKATDCDYLARTLGET